jgi:hypothetical protein
MKRGIGAVVDVLHHLPDLDIPHLAPLPCKIVHFQKRRVGFLGVFPSYDL